MEKERDMFEFTKLESLKNEIIERLTAIVNEEGTLGLVGKQIKELLLEFYREAGEAINEITQDYKHDLDFYGGPWALQKRVLKSGSVKISIAGKTILHLDI